jgi:hypothetical protein
MRINTESTEEAAEVIYQTMFSQRFADWYTGKFEKHLTADKDCALKPEIINDIKQIFKINQ